MFLQMEAVNYLAKNIRYLRRQQKLSQQKLASVLAVKRSNIAAYETKNVEPRLGLIYKMAEFFGVNLADLICIDLEVAKMTAAPSAAAALPARQDGTFTYDRAAESRLSVDDAALSRFREQSLNVRKMLEGFKVFYQYKQQLLDSGAPAEHRRIHSDVENFMIFIDHMLQYNESIIRLLDKPRNSAEGA